MISLLSRAEMRAFDADAIETRRVPSLVLMENAGRGAADVIERESLRCRALGKRVAIVCGAGNNGGDGFVVARQLLTRGARVETWLVGDTAMTEDCRTNHDAFVGIGGRVNHLVDDAFERLRTGLADADVIVDALFGTGLSRAIGAPFARAIEAMNDAAAPKVALDVPSGMNADTGATTGEMAVRATWTVTFAHPKLGHMTGRGARLSGIVRVVDLGVPAVAGVGAAAVSEAADVRALVRARPLDSHKYHAGHVAALAGSHGKVGAALLVGRGALRGGAGAATVVTWADGATALDARLAELMTARIEDDAPLEPQLDAHLANKRVVVVGPGLGLGDRARAAVHHVLATFRGPIVADADALRVCAGELDRFHPAEGRLVLTPHAGELAHLLGTTSDDVESDRFLAARTAAAKTRAVVLLKGPFSVIAAPDGRIVVNPTGNAALATAGSGDVLAGLAGALLCALTPFDAAWCAAYLHGAAGDAWSADHGDRGLLASEIADALPSAIAGLSRA